MDELRLRTVLQRVRLLPTFPEIVRNLVTLMDDPNASASDLKKYLDPSSASEILRVANTAYFGSKSFRTITSLEHAIAIIGFDHLSHILLQMPFISLLDKADPIFQRRGYVEHAIATASLSKILSEALLLAEPKVCYVAGLLHDIGVIVIYSRMKEEWQRIVALVQEGKGRIEAEREVLLFDHGYVGGLLLDMWNLPREIVVAVMFHHDLEGTKEFGEYAKVVDLANRLAKEMSRGEILSFEQFSQRYGGQISLLVGEGVCSFLALLENIYVQMRKMRVGIEKIGEAYDKGACR